MKRVVVVGAGVAGLSAAVELARAGATVTLVEGNAFAGGRFGTVGTIAFEWQSRTFRFPLDHGLHGFWRQYRNLGALMDSVGLGGRRVAVHAQELVLRRGEKTVAVEVGARVKNTSLPSLFAPLALLSSPELALATLRDGPLKYLKAGAQVLRAIAFDPSRDVAHFDHLTVADYLEDWPGWLERLFCALTHSGFFLDAKEVSLAAFLTGLSVYSVSDKRDAEFTTLDDAAGSGLIEPLVQVIESLGGEVLLSTRATALEAHGEGVALVLADGKRLLADAAVLALDPPGLAALKLPEQIARSFIERPVPPAVASVAVRLFFSKKPNEGRAESGIFGDPRVDNFFWLDRLQRPFRAWRSATGGAVLECHLYGSRAAQALVTGDAVVLESVMGAVEAGWPELSGSLAHGHVLRNPATHVAFTPGTLGRLPHVETSLPHIALAGDFIQTPWPTLYLERACLTGLLAARQLGRHLALRAMPDPLPPFAAARSVRALRPLLRSLL
jgi:carotenoid phi-ring synthase / carotenoid chi-ring synthase